MCSDWYWNRDNFLALGSLASALSVVPQLAGLGEWCVLREKGLRKQAFAALEGLLRAAAGWPMEEARASVLVVLDLARRFPEAHWFLSQPLKTRLVVPVLEAWRACSPEDPVPACELALLSGSVAELRAALSELGASTAGAAGLAAETLAGSGTDYGSWVRLRLASVLLDAVDFAGHHLSEGLFLGEVAEVLADLAEARALLDGVGDSPARAGLVELADALGALLDDWQAFLALVPAPPPVGFPAWCAGRGRSHRWWSVVHYSP